MDRLSRSGSGMRTFIPTARAVGRPRLSTPVLHGLPGPYSLRDRGGQLVDRWCRSS